MKNVVNVLQNDCFNQAQRGFESEIFNKLIKSLKKEYGEHFDYRMGNVQENNNRAHQVAKESDYDLVLHFKDFVAVEVVDGNIVKRRFPLDFYKLTINISLKEVYTAAPNRFLDCLNANLTTNQKNNYIPLDFNDLFHLLNDENNPYLVIKDNTTNKILIYNQSTLKNNTISQDNNFKLNVLLEDEGFSVKEKMKTFISKNTQNVDNIEELKDFIINKIVAPRMKIARKTEEYKEKMNNILEFFETEQLNRAATVNGRGENSSKHQRRGILHKTIEKCKIKKYIKICEFNKCVF